MPMKYILSFICFALFSTSSFAFDCNFVAGKSLCGVPLSAAKPKYIDALGEPDGIIEMGKGRQGLVYGQRMLLMFNDQHLWEIHAWTYNSNFEFWGYIRNHETRHEMKLLIGGESLWGKTRKNAQPLLAKFATLAGDQFSEIRETHDGSIFVFYQPTLEVDTAPNDWNSYQTNHVKISMHR